MLVVEISSIQYRISNISIIIVSKKHIFGFLDEKAAAVPDDVHVLPAGGVGEGLLPDPLPRRFHQGGARHQDRAHRGQNTGTDTH